MSLEGEGLRSWNKNTLILFADNNEFQLLLNTIHVFHNETNCIHGDCHIGNLVVSSTNPGKYVMVDLERVVSISDLTDDVYYKKVFCFMDTMHLMRQFYKPSLKLFLNKNQYLVSFHKQIHQQFCESLILPFVNENNNKIELNRWCQILIDAECGDNYLNCFDQYNQTVENILRLPYFKKPTLSMKNTLCTFLDIITMTSKFV